MMKNLFEVPGKPNCASFEEWEQWECDAKKSHPVRYFLSETFPTWIAIKWRQLVHEPWYWLKCRVWHRWNVVKCKTLPPTYCDPRERLLHAAFECLRAYIEDEQPCSAKQTWQQIYDAYRFPGCDGEDEVARKRADDETEINTLYRWWTVERAARIDPWSQIPEDWKSRDDRNAILFDARIKEDAFREEDNAKLARLVALREYLWT